MLQNLSNIFIGVLTGILASIITVYLIEEPIHQDRIKDAFISENCINYLTARIAVERYEQSTELKKLFSIDFYKAEIATIREMLTDEEEIIFNPLVFDMETANRTIEKNSYQYSDELREDAKTIIDLFHQLGVDNKLCYQKTRHYLLLQPLE